MVRRSAYLIAALPLVLAAALAGCGGRAQPQALHAAPEPADAPPPTGTPAGLLVAFPGHEPEGVVVDSSSRFAAVASRNPGQLIIVDATTLQPVRTIGGLGAARHLELAPGGEQVIVPAEDLDVDSVVDLRTGAVLTTVHVGRQPHDVADLGGTILTADEFGGAVTATRGAQQLGTLGGLIQPGGVGQAAGLAAVVDVRARLLDVYAPDPFRLTGRVAIGVGPTHAIGLGDGTVAVADTSGNQMLIVRVTGTPTVLARFPVPAGPYGLAVDLPRHRLWVAGSGDDTLRMFTLGAPGTVPTIGPTYVTVRQPNSLAVVPATGAVIVAGSTPTGALQEIRP